MFPSISPFVPISGANLPTPSQLALMLASATIHYGWAVRTSLRGSRSAMLVINSHSSTPKCCFALSHLRPPTVVSQCHSSWYRTWALVGKGSDNDLCTIHNPKGESTVWIDECSRSTSELLDTLYRTWEANRLDTKRKGIWTLIRVVR